MRTKPFDAHLASHAAFSPLSYLFLHVIRLALQLLDHPVQLSYLALVVSQVVTELATAAVELLQLLCGKTVMLSTQIAPSREDGDAPELHQRWCSREAPRHDLSLDKATASCGP